YEGENAKFETLWGGLLSSGLRIADGHTLKLDGLYTRSAEDELIRYEGENFDRGRNVRVTRLKYVERGILVASGGMEHVLPVMGGVKLNWKTSYTRSERSEPDRREYVYELFDRIDSTGAEYEVYELSRRDRTQDLTRFWSYLNEDDRVQTADLEVPFFSWNGLEAKARAGVLFENRDRRSRVRRFTYTFPGSAVDYSLSPEELLTPENIGSGTGKFTLEELTKPTDSYTARHDLNAQYAMVDLPLHRRLRLVTGARVERSDLIVATKNPFAVPDSTGSLPDSAVVAEARLEEQDVLPSANLTYQLTRDINLRTAFSRTLNRPDFRELSRSSYTNFISGGEEIGNANLQVAKLENYDVRAEYYLGPSELVAVSAFYKDIQEPIDRVRLVGNAGNTAYSYQNAKDGFLYGTELEARIRLGRFVDVLDAFSVNTNLTLVESEQTFVDRGKERTSPLLRQAPYVANLVLLFETLDGKTTASALYNVFGRRRSSVGLQETPDEYEEPRHSVDVTVGRRIGPVRLKVAAENILNEDEVYTADKPSLREEFVTDRQETGRGFSLSISYGS
ncbi:MAG TPA: TonB-dependent receptor, partial [bacterium]|nr:TonB-dependent receptor [bacterium]